MGIVVVLVIVIAVLNVVVAAVLAVVDIVYSAENVFIDNFIVVYMRRFIN